MNKQQKLFRLKQAMSTEVMPDMDKLKGGNGDVSNWRTNFHTPDLDNCFQELRVSGWSAEKDWTCCNTCGHYEMVDYFGKNKPYVFYHYQGAEELNETGTVHLNYGMDGATDSQIIIKARELCQVLEDYNLRPVWNGKLETKIKITVRKPQ